MCYALPRSNRQTPFGGGGRGDRAAWLPLLFIGSMMFWTIAVGLGTWSLMVVSDEAAVEVEVVTPPASAIEPKPGIEAAALVDGIPVQMEESQEPEDVNDNAGAAAPAVLVPVEPPGVAGTPRR